MSIKEEILALRNKAGFYKPEEILQWAEAHTKSALHKAIEWNDADAAHQYRLQQVRQLVRIYVVTEDHEPLLFSLSVDRVEGNGYRHRDDIAESRPLSEMLLQQALTELESIQRKYDMVKELTKVWEEARAAREKTVRRTRRSSSKKSQRPEERPGA